MLRPVDSFPGFPDTYTLSKLKALTRPLPNRLQGVLLYAPRGQREMTSPADVGVHGWMGSSFASIIPNLSRIATELLAIVS